MTCSETCRHPPRRGWGGAPSAPSTAPPDRAVGERGLDDPSCLVLVHAGSLAPPAPAAASTAVTLADKPPQPPATRADLLASFGPLVIAVRWGTVALGLGLAVL